MITVFYVCHTMGKRPVAFDPDGVPAHADMLRYDIAFHSPTDSSLIVFPIFTEKDGRTTSQITYARWNSFLLTLIKREDILCNVGSWITYQHPVGDYSKLVPTTLDQYMRDHKVKLAAKHRS